MQADPTEIEEIAADIAASEAIDVAAWYQFDEEEDETVFVEQTDYRITKVSYEEAKPYL